MRSSVSSEVRWLACQVVPLLRLNLLGLVSIVAASMLSLLDPLIVKWLIDVAIAKQSVELLVLGTIGFGAAYVCQLTFSYASYLIGFLMGQKLVFRLRIALIRRLHLFSARYYENMPVGELLYRIQQDVDRIGELGGDVLPSLIRMVIVTVMVLITMGILNLRLTLIIVPLLPLFYCLQRRYLRRLTLAAENTQQQMGSISSFLQEHIFGMRQLQLLNRTSTYGRRFARVFAAGARIQTEQRMAEVHLSAVSMFVIVLGSALILGGGGYDVIKKRLTVGGLVAFYSYVIRLFEPMSVALDLQSRLQRVAVSIRRIVGVLGHTESISGDGHPIQRLTRDKGGELEFKDVCFSYRRDRIVLDRLSLCVSDGERVAMVGASGSGKSTIGYLATRLYHPDGGAVLINGINLLYLGQRNLRSMVTAVPQEPVLFNATVRENLLYGDPSATSRDLDRVIALAQLRGVIQRLPRGLDEPLGPMGHQLSGGEKQRVALARAFLQRPKILILDEVTSALDGPMVTDLLEALDIFCKGRTVILISHKPSAMRWADRIIVLDQGRVLDHGQHQELVHRCELYRVLYHGLSRETANPTEIGGF